MALSWLPLSEGAPSPAYTLPAVPPFSLNAEPGAELACPGSMGSTVTQVREGCPVPGGFAASAVPVPSVAKTATETATISLRTRTTSCGGARGAPTVLRSGSRLGFDEETRRPGLVRSGRIHLFTLR